MALKSFKILPHKKNKRNFKKETEKYFGTFTYFMDSEVVSVSFCSRGIFPRFCGLNGSRVFAHNCVGQQFVLGSAGTARLSFHGGPRGSKMDGLRRWPCRSLPSLHKCPCVM